MTQLNRQRTPPKGRIITFYSYKGGTGRSMALANVAWLLALNGERVLVVDWDLEAPGVHRYFHPFLDDKELSTTEGLLDFVEKVAGRAAVSSSPLNEEDVDIIEYVTMLKWPLGSSLSWERFGDRARIDLLVAGRQGPSYSRKMNAFNWVDFYEKLNGRQVLSLAREQLRGVYDYVLIDSRTGVSDTSGICTVEMPDSLVVCFTLNDQSIKGASGVAESVVAQRASMPLSDVRSRNRPFRIFPVPTRVEIFSEKTKREVALALAQEKFAPFVGHIPKEQQSRYWGKVQLAYFPFYAFEEIPAVFGDKPGEELALMTPLKQIARYITDETFRELLPLADEEKKSEELRKEILGWYLRRAAAALPDLVQVAQGFHDQLSQEEQKIMKGVLLRLVQVGVGSPLGAVQLVLDDMGKPLEAMARKLAELGVIQITGISVFIADRKLIENWDDLKRWAIEDQSFLQWRQSLTVSARSWQQSGRDESGLLRGRLLEDAIRWLGVRPADLNEIEREFITESKEKRKPDEKASEATSFRKKNWSFLAGVAAALLAAYGSTYLVKWNEGRTTNKDAAIITLAGVYESRDPLIAALLLSELKDHSASESDRAFALRVANSAIPEAMIRGDHPFKQLQFARDGATIATAGEGGIELWETKNWKKIRSLNAGASSISASFNGWVPDRAKLRGASGQIDHLVTVDTKGIVQVWTLDGHAEMKFSAENLGPSFLGSCQNRVAQKKPGIRSTERLGKPIDAHFSPDETVVLVAYENATVVMLDAKSGACFDVYSPKSSGPAAFTPDAEWIATLSGSDLTLFHVQDWLREPGYVKMQSDGTIPRVLAASVDKHILLSSQTDTWLWSSATQGSLRGMKTEGGAFSWDAKSVATVYQNSVSLQPTSRSTGSSDTSNLVGHSAAVTSVDFNPVGTQILTASDDKTLRIWPTRRKLPSTNSSWKELLAYLKGATRVCLTADQHKQFFNEKDDVAKSNVEHCEAQQR